MAEKTDKTEQERRDDALKNLTAAFNQLKGKVEAQAEKPKTEEKAPAKKVYTRAELRKGVNDGQITEDQMDEILERQAEERISAKFDERLKTETATGKRVAKIEAQIDTIIDANPDLKNNESDLFKKVAAKFNDLVNERGMDRKDLNTELMAMELVVGHAAPKGRKRELEAHEETGGAGGGHDRGGDDSEAEWSKGIPAKNRDFFKQQIAKGLYTGVNDPRLKKQIERLRKVH